MLQEIWEGSATGRIFVNILGGLSIVVAIYLLLISYRKLLIYFGRGKLKKITVKYAEVFELNPPYAKGTVQFGFELFEEANVEFNIIDNHDNLVKNLFAGTLNKGIHPFVFDTTEFKNGYYYYQYKSDIQNIIKKFAIDN